MYFRGTAANGSPTLAGFDAEAILVDKLGVNLLLGMDHMGPERFVIDLDGSTSHIRPCDVTIPMSAWYSKKHVRTAPLMPVRAMEACQIEPSTTRMVSISHAGLHGNSYIFEPKVNADIASLAQLVDGDTKAILLQNTTGTPYQVGRHEHLGDLGLMQADVSVVHVGEEMTDEAIDLARKAIPRPPKHIFEQNPPTEAIYILLNDITVCRRPGCERLDALLQKYSAVFEDKGFASPPSN